tara:strand:- start:814 stop:1443 length:630 start_codon:yes stop_codon:yes gene_type:complete
MANKNKKNKRGGKRSIFKKTKQNKKRKTIKRKIIKNYKKKTKLHKGGENLKSNKLSLDEIITELKREELYIKLRAPGTNYFKNQKTVNSLYNTFVELLDDIIILMKRIVDNIYSLNEEGKIPEFNKYKKKYNELNIEDIIRNYYQFFKDSTTYIYKESFTSNVYYKNLIILKDNLNTIDREMIKNPQSLHIAGELNKINERKINNLMKI